MCTLHLFHPSTLHLFHISFATANKDLMTLTLTLRNYSGKEKIKIFFKKYFNGETAPKITNSFQRKAADDLFYCHIQQNNIWWLRSILMFRMKYFLLFSNRAGIQSSHHTHHFVYKLCIWSRAACTDEILGLLHTKRYKPKFYKTTLFTVLETYLPPLTSQIHFHIL